MKGLILYKGKYGATRQYAVWAGYVLQLPIITVDHCTDQDIADRDTIILGSSVYMGKLLIKDWLYEHRELLRNKKLIIFIVSATPNSEAEKQEGIVRNNIPSGIVDRNNIFFLPGKLEKKKLEWKDRIILALGASLEKDPARKKAMREDMNGVEKQALTPLINAVRKITGPLRSREFSHAQLQHDAS